MSKILVTKLNIKLTKLSNVYISGNINKLNQLLREQECVIYFNEVDANERVIIINTEAYVYVKQSKYWDHALEDCLNYIQNKCIDNIYLDEPIKEDPYYTSNKLAGDVISFRFVKKNNMYDYENAIYF
jgi:hypothetical protein